MVMVKVAGVVVDVVVIVRVELAELPAVRTMTGGFREELKPDCKLVVSVTLPEKPSRLVRLRL